MNARRFRLIAPLAALAALASPFASLYAQGPNSITFINRSGDNAVVRLSGPSGQEIQVPTGSSRTVHVSAGPYRMLVRYGDTPSDYTYSEGEPFRVVQTENQYSEISITLHKVEGGNYSSHPISRAEFEKRQ